MIDQDGYYRESQNVIADEPVTLRDRVLYKKQRVLFNTGGTITSEPSSQGVFKTGVRATDLAAKSFLTHWLDLNKVDLINSKVVKLSEEYTCEDLKIIGVQLKQLSKKYKTVIITTGTDNISTVAMWVQLNANALKYYVLTAQKSIDKPTSQFPVLLKGVQFLQNLKSKNLMSGVVLVYNPPQSIKVLSPYKVVKMHTTRRGGIDDGYNTKILLDSKLMPTRLSITGQYRAHTKRVKKITSRFSKKTPHMTDIYYHHIANYSGDRCQHEFAVSTGLNNLPSNCVCTHSKTRVPLGPENPVVYSTNSNQSATYTGDLSLDAWILLASHYEV